MLRLTREALELVVTESQCYPYFIPACGARRCRKQAQEVGPTLLDKAAVECARPAVVTEQEDYYQDRYAELESRGLLGNSAGGGDGLRRPPHIEHSRDEPGHRRWAGEAGPLQPRYSKPVGTCGNWAISGRPPGRNDWEPGIPSLMDYVRVQADITPDPAPTLPGPG